MKKSIAITSYYFYPEITPRAFRAFELAKEFANQDYDVTVFIPSIDYDYSYFEEKYHIKIIKINSFFFKKHNRKLNNDIEYKKNKYIYTIFQYLSNFSQYILGYKKDFEYILTLFYTLLKNSKKYDILISIALPFSVHVGSALAILLKKNFVKISIADYGDPYYYNKAIKLCFYHKYFEYFIMKFFNYITIPIEKAVDSYIFLKSKEYIKIIPQGYDFSEIKIVNYSPNKIPTFAYAGLFYKEIRNPKLLFEYLLTLDKEFQFIIYTDINNKNNMECISKYIPKLGKKLIIKNLIERKECIYELSKKDFLINVENISLEQSPSKLIDYFFTQRPIFSFNPNNFNKELFNNFMNSNYENKMVAAFDINNYNIKNICNEFKKLF